MSENDNNGRKPLTLKPRPGGSISSGTVKQSFSHGRTKTVVVETKRARPHAPPGGNLAAPSAAERRVFEPAPRPAAPPQGQRPTGPGDGLSAEERAARQRVIEQAQAQRAQQEAERRAREERERAAAEAARAAQAAAAQAAAAPPAAEAP
ncbi:MAG: IF-2-associated domain-containing protein, partial [Phenylobacterium sp.]|uniref:IF-2-associated domain-containing protein n=1 Tax=Phenylobacterium sp. TaxID=1871053 RepID=UPI001A497398